MIKNIIFDWSGVIKDCVNEHLWVVNKLFQRFGVSEISLEELKQNWEQPHMRFYNKYLPNITNEQQLPVYKEFVVQAKDSEPYPGIVELIKELKAKGIKMTVLSSDLELTLLPEMKRFGLEGVFDFVIAGVYHKKEGLIETLEKNNFKKEETLFVGDSNHEIEEGREVGIKTCAVTWGFCTTERLAEMKPDFLATNLDELRQIVTN